MILFAVAGMAGMHFFGKEWALPTGVLVGLIVAPMVPIPPKKG